MWNMLPTYLPHVYVQDIDITISLTSDQVITDLWAISLKNGRRGP